MLRLKSLARSGERRLSPEGGVVLLLPGSLALLGLFILGQPVPPANAVAATVAAAGQEVILSVTPVTKTVATGETFTLTLQVETGVQSVDAVQVVVSFPPTILEVVDAEAATAGVQIARGTTLPMVLQNTVDNGGGQIKYAAGVTLDSEFRPSGTFALATVSFLAKAGGSAVVAFGAESYAVSQGERLTGSTKSGVITVQAPTGGSGGSGGRAWPGDASGNCEVTGLDFSILVLHFLVGQVQTDPVALQADFNGDGMVDSQDFSILFTYFATRCPTLTATLAGTQMTVTGDNYLPNLAVIISLDGSDFTTPTAVSTDVSGHFTTTLTVTASAHVMRARQVNQRGGIVMAGVAVSAP